MVTGVVEAKSNKFDKFSILLDNGNWYSSKFEIKANKGDTVEFDDGGKKYCSKLKVVSSGGGSASTGGAVSSGTAKPAYSRGAFPVPQLDGSRAILRQNAVTNANTFFGNNAAGQYTVEELLEVARMIEEYTSGDIEAKNVEAKVKASFDPEA